MCWSTYSFEFFHKMLYKTLDGIFDQVTILEHSTVFPVGLSSIRSAYLKAGIACSIPWIEKEIQIERLTWRRTWQPLRSVLD